MMQREDAVGESIRECPTKVGPELHRLTNPVLLSGDVFRVKDMM